MQPHQEIETDADDYQTNHRTKYIILYNIGVCVYIYRYTFIYIAYHINYFSPLQSITCNVLMV